MAGRIERRDLLRSGGILASALALGDLAFLSHLPHVSAASAHLDPRVVRLESGIEPTVRLIEETPRERLLEEVAVRIRQGLTYREVLAALLLAGVRNIEPRPQVGFKFHAVLVVNSAHLASLASPPEHRWLPIFWALDHYKSSEAADTAERNWTMRPVDEKGVPSAGKARQAFINAMDNWDEAAADVAIAGLARTAKPAEIFELFDRYGCRDFRSIGHKAIYVSNSWRTLNCIGWQYAEPVLRSLAYALLMHEGGNPAKGDAEADQPGRRNAELVKKIRKEWRDGKLDREATRSFMQTLRSGSSSDASQQVVELLNRGVAPQSVWDALFLASGEYLMQQPAIVALHAVTTTNALRFAFETSGNDENRRLLLLQNAAFLPMFRGAMEQRGRLARTSIDNVAAAATPQPDLTSADIFGELSRNPQRAIEQALSFLKTPSKSPQSKAKELRDAARLLVFLKGTDAHDYKFSSAIFEDYDHISPEWRDLFLASNLIKLRGAGDPENRLVQRTRAALKR